MKRALSIIVLLFVFSIPTLAGHQPISGYEGCPHPGIYWQATWPDTVSYCCQPNEYCPVGGGEGFEGERPAPVVKQDDVFTSIFLNFYKGRLF
jgi:hypothetical protein